MLKVCKPRPPALKSRTSSRFYDSVKVQIGQVRDTRNGPGPYVSKGQVREILRLDKICEKEIPGEGDGRMV